MLTFKPSPRPGRIETQLVLRATNILRKRIGLVLLEDREAFAKLGCRHLAGRGLLEQIDEELSIFRARHPRLPLGTRRAGHLLLFICAGGERNDA